MSATPVAYPPCLFCIEQSKPVLEVLYEGKVRPMCASCVQEYLRQLRTRYLPTSASTLPPFPEFAMSGTLGELAIELTKGTEIPKELVFATALTCFGIAASGQLKLDVGLDDSDTRLYTVLLGTSYDVKKSSAMKRAIDFFADIRLPQPLTWKRISGVGSAEGLGLTFANDSKKVLLAYDELKAFFDKTKIEGSSLLSMITSLFQESRWDNRTKGQVISVEDARLAIVGCCTSETYGHVWGHEALSIGLPNRLFIVSADAKPKVAWPGKPDEAKLQNLKHRIQAQLLRLPMTMEITPEGKRCWERWYNEPKSREYARRLDTIGFRLLPILALANDNDKIGLETVQAVTALLRYELTCRMAFDPIDAENETAKMEQKITRLLLRKKVPQSKRAIFNATNAKRVGGYIFGNALRNLQEAGDVVQRPDKTFSLTTDAENENVA